MGGWEPPYGISLRIDAVNAPILLLIASMAVLSMVYAQPATGAEISERRGPPFYAAFLLCIAGLMGMVVTGDAFNVFVFLEVSSISTYTLVALGANRDRRALSAAFNYLILGSIGATFFVIGVGFLYAETGTLNMEDIRRILANLDGGSRVAQVAFGFIVVGLGLKLALFPLHTWLPGAYAYSPTVITAFLASTATKAALYLLYRFCFTVFDPSFDYVMVVLTYVITGLAAGVFPDGCTANPGFQLGRTGRLYAAGYRIGQCCGSGGFLSPLDQSRRCQRRSLLGAGRDVVSLRHHPHRRHGRHF
jgi:multicomponent Na+:H+ antiporter subunit D